jgi:hypothetical protein
VEQQNQATDSHWAIHMSARHGIQSGCAAASAYDQVHAVGVPGVGIVFDPVLEQVLVAREHQSDMMRVEQRHVALAEFERRVFDVRSAVGTGRERRLVTEDENVDVPGAIQSFELAPHPGKRAIIVSDIAVQSEDEGVALPERERRIV